MDTSPIRIFTSGTMCFFVGRALDILRNMDRASITVDFSKAAHTLLVFGCCSDRDVCLFLREFGGRPVETMEPVRPDPVLRLRFPPTCCLSPGFHRAVVGSADRDFDYGPTNDWTDDFALDSQIFRAGMACISYRAFLVGLHSVSMVPTIGRYLGVCRGFPAAFLAPPT